MKKDKRTDTRSRTSHPCGGRRASYVAIFTPWKQQELRTSHVRGQRCCFVKQSLTGLAKQHETSESKHGLKHMERRELSRPGDMPVCGLRNTKCQLNTFRSKVQETQETSGLTPGSHVNNDAVTPRSSVVIFPPVSRRAPHHMITDTHTPDRSAASAGACGAFGGAAVDSVAPTRPISTRSCFRGIILYRHEDESRAWGLKMITIC